MTNMLIEKEKVEKMFTILEDIYDDGELVEHDQNEIPSIRILYEYLGRKIYGKKFELRREFLTTENDDEDDEDEEEDENEEDEDEDEENDDEEIDYGEESPSTPLSSSVWSTESL